MESDLFRKNLERWALMCPEGVDRVKGLEGLQVDFCNTIKGALNLISKNDNRSFYFHSQIDPIEEAAKWFSGLKLKDVNVIFVYGVGLGYCYEAAKEWLRKDQKNNLVFFEENPEVIHRLLESDRCKDLLYDPQVAIYLFEKTPEGIGKLNSHCAIYSPFNFIVTALAEQNQRKFFEFKSILTFFTLMNRSEVMEYSRHGTVIFKNIFKNYLNLPTAYLADKLLGTFKNVPAIICGAGPSLDRNIELLSSIQDRALIFAGGTAMNALNSRGIMPHFGVGIDPNPAQFTRLIMNYAYETPFLYRSRMLYEALEIVHGDRLYVSGSAGYNITKWMEKALGLRDLGKGENELEEGHNVLNFSLALAHLMGCNPIITVGVDLAYSQGNSYASGIINHPIHNRQSHFKTKHIEEELVCKLDIYGSPVYTLWKWIGEASWYGGFAKAHPDVTIINATEGGIGFPEIINLTLLQVCDNFLKNPADLTAMVYGEIQNSSMPKEVTTKRIKELLHALAENLRACSQQIDKIIAILARDGVQSKELINEIEKLQKEEAYQSMLKVFNDYYIKIHGMELQHIHLQADLISKEEVLHKKNAYEIQRYNSLRLTAQYNASLIQHLLNETESKALMDISKNKKVKKTLKVPKTNKKDVYKFDYQDPSHAVMTLIDPEMELNYSEKFSHPEDAVKRTYYSNGTLKSEFFYQENALHGPSSFYSPDGKLLSRTWFIRGMRQGKKWTYYTSGEVHSLERFYQGKPHGKQEYYYQDRTPKSIFSYKNGIIDGEVILYHGNGQLSRQLNFILGKREGVEHIWDESGLLRIEAHYKADRPIQTARIWHSNGILASETVYDRDSRRIEMKEWDVSGKLYPPDVEADDFFDAAARGLKDLTDSLGDICGVLSKMLPEEQSLKKGSTHDSLMSDIEKLRLEMEKLNSIEKKIHAHMEFDDEDPQEAIWKNPTTQKEMEKQIEKMANPMEESLKEIQKEFKKLLSSLIKPPPPNQDE